MVKSDYIVKVLGIFFILIGLLAFFNSFYYNRPEQVLWFCYLGLIFIGCGALMRNSYLIASQLSILAVPFIFWIVDFVSYFFIPGSLFGITLYLFQPGPLLPKIISLQHLFTIPLSLYLLSEIRIKKFDFWKISILQISLIFIVTRIFTRAETNVNCAYKNCLPFQVPYYPFWWFVAVIAMIFLTTFAISKLNFVKKR